MTKKIENIVISKEYLDKIRNFAAIQPNETFVYVPIAYRNLPDELKPRFTLSPISGEDCLRYADMMRGEVFVDGGKAQVQIKHGEYTIAVVKKGLRQWDNYYDINGNVIPFQVGNISNFDVLPRELLEELSEAITSKSKLTNEEMLGLK